MNFEQESKEAVLAYALRLTEDYTNLRSRLTALCEKRLYAFAGEIECVSLEVKAEIKRVKAYIEEQGW